ncbi:MAG: tetratricopeptide repeat protein [Acidobacteria bacterium]|nr:tetratricopeptide repeat protein [Acidobacteriota bacterium]
MGDLLEWLGPHSAGSRSLHSRRTSAHGLGRQTLTAPNPGRATPVTNHPQARTPNRLSAGENAAVVGPAGLGKTALAAKALLAVVGHTPQTLAASPFPGGVVFLDLYTFHGEAQPAWGALANTLAGPDFMPDSPAKNRATEACRGRRILVVIEGGEEADGAGKRAGINELLSVLSPQNRRLLLTRQITQTVPAETVKLEHALQPADAARLLDSLTQGRVMADVRDRVLALLEGHPLALTWAGNLLARGDESPQQLAGDWEHESLPSLSHPMQAQHTLKWLFDRSVRGLDDPARKALEAAGLLARAPFPLAAIDAALGGSDGGNEKGARDALRSLVQRGLLRLADVPDQWEFTHVLGYRFARKESGSDAVIRERLGAWLHGHLAKALAPDAAAEGPLVLSGALEHLGALLRADDDQRLWRPLAKRALYEIADRLEDLGRLGQVMLALDAVAGWMERFPANKAAQPEWLHENTVLKIDQADVLLEQGDLKGALGAYRESEAVIRRLAEADPSNAARQRDLSFSLTRMAQFHEQQGKRSEALDFAEQSLAIDERLAALDPTNVTWQRDVEITRAMVARLRG